MPAEGADNRPVYRDAWRTGVWSVMFKQPQLQIGRDYTPLPDEGDEDGDSLRFLIRRDPFGEVSRYLHGLELGSLVELRGPQIQCPIPSYVRDILFIAGGTGIAPALQASYALLSRADDADADDAQKPKKQIHILWASRKREDCLGGVSDSKVQIPWLSRLFGRSPASSVQTSPDPPHAPIACELEKLKSQYPGQVRVDYFVDEEGTFIDKRAILDHTTKSTDPSSMNKLILVSGPDGFISSIAGRKVWAQGMELQGPLQGMIKDLGLNDWTVWKL